MSTCIWLHAVKTMVYFHWPHVKRCSSQAWLLHQENHTLWRDATLTRVLQLNSNHSWSDVDRPLEGDLILPIIAHVFGVTEYWFRLLSPRKILVLEGDDRLLRECERLPKTDIDLRVLSQFSVFYTSIISRHHLAMRMVVCKEICTISIRLPL